MSLPHKERVNYFQNLSLSTKSLFGNVIRTTKIKKAGITKINTYLDLIMNDIYYRKKNKSLIMVMIIIMV